MIRIFWITFLLLPGCAFVELRDVPEIASEIFFVESIDIDKEYFDQRSFSFAKFSQGRRSQAVGVLLSINNNIYEWFLGNNERIFTKHGKIIKTENLERNFVIQDTRNVLHPNKSHNYEVIAALSNPDAYTSIAYDWAFKKEEEVTLINSHITKKYSEKFSAEGLYWKNIFWRKQNTYWVDADTQRVIMSHQHIHPYAKPIKIEFYYK